MIGDEVLDFAQAADILALESVVVGTVAQIVAEGSAAADSARRIHRAATGDRSALTRLRGTGALTPLADVHLDAPLPQPRTIVANGQAYRSHLRDWDNDDDVRPDHPPSGFLKSPSAIVGTGAPIQIPRAAPEAVDFEGELCVVFARTCYEATRETAMDFVGGYTIINDVSARVWVPFMRRPENAQNPAYGALNTMYKNFPTFCPMGPWVTTTDEVPDYRALRLVTRLNGNVMQDATLSELIWDIPELIESYSSVVRFEPGDLLSTGTPGGVGAGCKPPVFMRDGDTVSVDMGVLGELVNPIVGPRG